MHKLSEQINKAFQHEKWAEAKHLIVKELKNDPTNHWLISRLSAANYELRDYKKALRLAKKAKAIKPDCPLVQWDLAGALFANGMVRPALKIYHGLVKNAPKLSKQKPCGEGTNWVISLLVDCIFRIATCYVELGKNDVALRYLTKFIQLRLGWADGIYSLEEGIRELGDVVKKNVQGHEQNHKLTERKLGDFSKELQAV